MKIFLIFGILLSLTSFNLYAESLDERSYELNIQNSSEYYVNIKELSLVAGNSEIVVKKNDLIAPKAKVSWVINNNTHSLNDSKIKLTLVNDYGALVVHEIPLNK